MGKANHLKPIHTGGTSCITTRREPEQNKTATQAINGRRTGVSRPTVPGQEIQ
jgi:hypothetical protein